MTTRRAILLIAIAALFLAPAYAADVAVHADLVVPVSIPVTDDGCVGAFTEDEKAIPDVPIAVGVVVLDEVPGAAGVAVHADLVVPVSVPVTDDGRVGALAEDVESILAVPIAVTVI